MKLFWVPFGLKPKPEAETGPRYADIYVRAVAAGIDLSILFFLLHDAFIAVTNTIYSSLDPTVLAAAYQAPTFTGIIANLWHAHALHLWAVNAVFQVIVMGVLLVGSQWAWRTTPGKWVMGIQIVDAVTFEAPSRWRFLARFLAYIPASIPAMLGVIWISFNRQRRGWHDYIAGTTVIHTRPRDWAWVQTKRGFRWLREQLFPATQKKDH